MTLPRSGFVQQRVAGKKPPKVLYYGINGSTAGKGNLMDEAIHLAGGHNVIRDTNLEAYPAISPEMAIGLQPDIILLSDWPSAEGFSSRDRLMQDPAWKDVPAVIHGRVYSLRGAWLTSSSPFQVSAVEEIARLIHPDAFEPTSKMAGTRP